MTTPRQQSTFANLWREKLLRWFPAILFVLALGYYLWAVSVGWNHTVADWHPFRQTQTAITAYYMVRMPFKLAYETPILGPPWAIPMEFPFYQWLAAGLVKMGGFSLDQTGRFLSVAFYLLTLIPVWVLLGVFRVAPRHRLVVLALMLASPFYIFWSRTFMIETCVIFFCVAYLACAFKGFESRKPAMFALSLVFGVLAGLIKITTVLPFAAAVGLFAIRDGFKAPLRFLNLDNVWRRIVPAVLLAGLPVAAGIGWTRYADALKEQNALAHFLTSASLTDWNFGTLDQKLSFDTWFAIIQRTPTLFSDYVLFWAACIVVAVFATGCCPRWKPVLACTGFFLLSPFLFTNLHFIHDYYMCANGIFLIAAAGFLIVGFLESKGWGTVGAVLAGGMLLAGVYGHQTLYLPIQKQNANGLLPFAQKIRDATPADAVNVLIGLDWDPTFAYFSERRALMIPEMQKKRDVRQAIKNLRGQKIGVVLILPKSRWTAESIVRMMMENGLPTDRVFFFAYPRLESSPVNPHSYSWVALNDRGVELVRGGHTDEGIAKFRESFRVNPAYAEAHNNLGSTLFQQGWTEEAVAEYRKALQIDPDGFQTHCNLGFALFQQGWTREAVAEYRESLRINPGCFQAHCNLGNALLKLNLTEEAIGHLKKAHELQPDNASLENDLAWLLVTAQPASSRDGTRAVQLATHASAGNNPQFLRTLAAAYAETGDFHSAVRTVQNALQQTGAGSLPALVDALRLELKLYETGHRIIQAR